MRLNSNYRPHHVVNGLGLTSFQQKIRGSAPKERGWSHLLVVSFPKTRKPLFPEQALDVGPFSLSLFSRINLQHQYFQQQQTIPRIASFSSRSNYATIAAAALYILCGFANKRGAEYLTVRQLSSPRGTQKIGAIKIARRYLLSPLKHILCVMVYCCHGAPCSVIRVKV